MPCARTALIALLLLSALVAAPAAQAAPATAARTCKAPEYPGEGYFTSMIVTGTNCARGTSVALAYYRCRTKTGPKGRCTKRVLGYSCTEKRTSIPTEINARVTCKRGRAKIVHTYQQNT